MAPLHLGLLRVKVLQGLLLFGQRDGRVVVEALRHQLQGERILLAARLLDLGALVLEPDLDLGLVQAQLRAQLLSPLLRQVSVLVEFVLHRGGEEAEERFLH